MLIVEWTNIDGSRHAASMREPATTRITTENNDRRMMPPRLARGLICSGREKTPRQRSYQRAGGQSVTKTQQQTENCRRLFAAVPLKKNLSWTTMSKVHAYSRRDDASHSVVFRQSAQRAPLAQPRKAPHLNTTF